MGLLRGSYRAIELLSIHTHPTATTSSGVRLFYTVYKQLEGKKTEVEEFLGRTEAEEILNKVFAIFKEKYKDEFNFVDED